MTDNFDLNGYLKNNPLLKENLNLPQVLNKKFISGLSNETLIKYYADDQSSSDDEGELMVKELIKRGLYDDETGEILDKKLEKLADKVQNGELPSGLENRYLNNQ